MKIIFLDHFGVMCLADKHGIINNNNDLPRVNEIRIMNDYDNFDKNAVNILNEILITDNEIEIIVSSDWNRFGDLNRMQNFYIEQGIIKKPIDFTPDLNINDLIYKRTKEIKEWLQQNNVVIDKWVAIDDLYITELENFVWVSRTDEGITQQGIKEQILEKLN